jgi:hypothetical protein
MFFHSLHRLLPVALAFVGAAAEAQTPSPPKSDPLDAGGSAPAVTYRSPLAGYKGHADQPVGSWRQANDTVNKVGGWRAYAREAAQTGESAASAPSTPPAAGGHGGHKNEAAR